MSEHGTIDRDGDHFTVRFERLLEATPAEVWSALTDPARLAEWLAAATIEPGENGQFLVDFGSGDPEGGRITAWDAQRVLAFEWRYGDDPPSHVEWRLTAVEDGRATVLELTHTLLSPSSAPGFGAGWHELLDRLDAHLAGEPRPTTSRDVLLPTYGRLRA